MNNKFNIVKHEDLQGKRYINLLRRSCPSQTISDLDKQKASNDAFALASGMIWAADVHAEGGYEA